MQRSDAIRTGPDPPTARLCHCAAAARRPAVSVTLLGGFVVHARPRPRARAGECPPPPGRRWRVGLLALGGRPGGSRMAGMLWPDPMEHRALASLRTGIWRVNQAAGQLISATKGTVDLSAGVAVDVRQIVEHGRVMLMGGADDSLDHANAALDSDGD